MKDIELRLISELMKNSRRSDRELAKTLGVSQPTVSRTIQRLEKEGVIKEYTIVPDFTKVGLGLLTITFVKYKSDLTSEKRAKAMETIKERAGEASSPEAVMIERGIGFGYDTVVVSYVKDYSDYMRLLNRIRTYEHVQPDELKDFIVDLSDKVHFRPFTFSTLAEYLSSTQKERKE